LVLTPCCHKLENKVLRSEMLILNPPIKARQVYITCYRNMQYLYWFAMLRQKKVPPVFEIKH